MPTPIDPTLYLHPPHLGIDASLSLAKMLLLAVPRGAGPGVLTATKALAAYVDTLETTWNTHDKPKPPRTGHATDIRLDRAWSAVHARLTAWSIFPEEDPEHQASADSTARLFATGLDFLELYYVAEHEQSERRLRLIEAEGLRADLDRLVGKPFMAELVAAHAEYGEALGIAKPPERVDLKTLLHEPLRALSDAIATHALQLVAFAALSPEHVAPARRALRPIDVFRAAANRHAAASPHGSEPNPDDFMLPEGAPPPDAPMPALPEQ